MTSDETPEHDDDDLESEDDLEDERGEDEYEEDDDDSEYEEDDDASEADDDASDEGEDASDEDEEDEEDEDDGEEPEEEPEADAPVKAASEPPTPAAKPPVAASPPPKEAAPPPAGSRPALYLAEFDDVGACAKAAARVRDAGYEKWDVHTPYPVHGMDDAMGLPSTKIGIISFVCGMTGVTLAILMMQWMNGVDYPLIIGGKPADAWISMGPIIFELGILLTGFGTVFGLLHLCRLPRHHHPVFESERFKAASDDRFFISVEAADPRFDLDKTRALLEGASPTHLELVEEDL